MALGPIPQFEIGKKVSEYCTLDGSWNWAAFNHLLPQDILMSIGVIPLPSHVLGEDANSWTGFYSIFPRAGVLSLLLQSSIYGSSAMIGVLPSFLRIKNDQHCDIKWYPPSPGWIKLNVDGSRHNTTRSSACGGVARDENGNWLFGFAKRLGKRNAIYAEIWGIFFEVRIAKEKGYPRVMIEVDSKSALELIVTESTNNQQLHTMARRIREIAKYNWQVIFSHTIREGNKIVHALLNRGHRVYLDIVMFDNPPRWCSDLYQDDLSGLGLSRLVPC
ncbi:ribonuclease H [Senna tora]|uniref:Ribonuclease H n=1 Tax=Senna tora TaxID=362788 RepID=A0A834TR04_9FABA|nr:ribonuclease H [Senna tora]